jgi:hypothetical protein
MRDNKKQEGFLKYVFGNYHSGGLVDCEDSGELGKVMDNIEGEVAKREAEVLNLPTQDNR